MTIQTILEQVRIHRPYSVHTFYRDAEKLGIRPLGDIIRQHPAQFPEDTAQKILIHRGFVARPRHRALNGSKALVTIPQLRKARKKARGK